MLHKFLLAERDGILALSSAKLMMVSDSKGSSGELDVGLPLFYDELLEVLRADEEEDSKEISDRLTKGVHRESAQRRGKESLRLGYTISQVVHGYGALCQAITEYAGKHETPVTLREFNRLNFCLDVAIAEAVTEFSKDQRESATREEVQRLGFLAHEMRNALGNVALAYQMIKKGVVGVAGSTNMLLENSILRMKDIIDRSLAEVRLRGQPIVNAKRCRVIDLVSAVEATSVFEADDKSIQIHVDVPPTLLVLADRHLMISAISNLVQNAIKFTKPHGHVWIGGSGDGNRVLIEVEDQCGGLPTSKIDELFQPYIQKDANKTGIGLGLSITRNSVELCGGRVSARDVPGKGCIFTLEIPQVVPHPGESEGLGLPIQ